MISGFCKK